jgi:6-oxo-cyclohex-1-ene-carbonyl-CoA hydrolase
MKDYNLITTICFKDIIVEKRPLLDLSGKAVKGLFNSWIILNNPSQLNSFTTDMIKEIILALRQASCDRSTVAVIVTGAGEKAFCSGGNTKEYAEYYAGNPQEYNLYMRLFIDMITGILLCDKPVINRVNGLRIGGGQEIGMACDFSIAADTAVFGQAGPKHGSAPDGGATDFMHLFVGIGNSMESCALCERWSGHRALRLGLINRIAPVLKTREGKFIPNPLVTLSEIDEFGRPCFGAFLTGEEKEKAGEVAEACTIDFGLLDKEVETMAYSLAMTMPGCLMKTIESLRKKKLDHWQRNCETNRAWLALNMMTEARAGFTAFNKGEKGNREVDFIALRRLLATGTPWTDIRIEDIMPPRKQDPEKKIRDPKRKGS